MAGLPEEKILAVLDYETSPLLSEREKLVVEYAQQVTEKAGGVDLQLLSRVQTAFSPEEIVELTMAICVFQVYNRCNDIFGAEIDLPPGPDPLYEKTFRKP